MVQRWLVHQDCSLSADGSPEAQGGKCYFGGRVNILVLLAVLPLNTLILCVLLWLFNQFCV